MHTHYRTQGVILKKENRGEADQLFDVFTEDFGKIEVLGRGVRKITSKLRAAVEVFYLSEIEFIQGQVYKTLTDATLLDKLPNVRQDSRELSAAYRIVQAADVFILKPEKDERIWRLLVACLKKTDDLKGQPTTLDLTYYFFLWNLLAFLGYKPELYFCPLCRQKVKPGSFFFVPLEGGLVCHLCFKHKGYGKSDGLIIEDNAVKTIRILLTNPLDILGRLRLNTLDLANIDIASRFLLRSFQPSGNGL